MEGQEKGGRGDRRKGGSGAKEREEWEWTQPSSGGNRRPSNCPSIISFYCVTHKCADVRLLALVLCSLQMETLILSYEYLQIFTFFSAMLCISAS